MPLVGLSTSLGHRITETPDANVLSGPATDLYYSTLDQVLQENQSSGNLTVQTRYVWSPVYVNAMILRDYKFSVGSAFNMNDRSYALQDANYNTTAMVDYQDFIDGDANNDGVVNITDLTVVANNWQQTVTGGAADGDFNNDGFVDIQDLTIVANNWQSMGSKGWKVVERMSYNAYGKQSVYNKFWVVADDFLNWNYTFQGGREDKATGLINFDNRDYNPRTMTWNTAEPFGAGYIDGMNLYRAFDANPTNLVDPFGLIGFAPGEGPGTGTDAPTGFDPGNRFSGGEGAEGAEGLEGEEIVEVPELLPVAGAALLGGAAGYGIYSFGVEPLMNWMHGDDKTSPGTQHIFHPTGDPFPTPPMAPGWDPDPDDQNPQTGWDPNAGGGPTFQPGDGGPTTRPGDGGSTFQPTRGGLVHNPITPPTSPLPAGPETASDPCPDTSGPGGWPWQQPAASQPSDDSPTSRPSNEPPPKAGDVNSPSDLPDYKNWPNKPTDTPGGTQYTDPTNPGRTVREMPQVTHEGADPAKRSPNGYIRYSDGYGGVSRPIPR